MALNIGSLLQTGASAFGGPWGAVAGGVLGGLFGGGSKLPPEMQRLLRMQMRAARELRSYSKSVPLSDPGERAALATQHGLLGEQQRDQSAQLFGALNPGSTGSVGDFMTNLGNQQIGQRSALDSAHLFNALQNRRQALLQSAQVAQGATGAAGAYQQQGPDFGALFGQLAERSEYLRRIRQSNQSQAPPVQGGGPGTPPWLRRR